MRVVRAVVVLLSLVLLLTAATAAQLVHVARTALLNPDFYISTADRAGVFDAVPAAVGEALSGMTKSSELPAPIEQQLSAALETVGKEVFAPDWVRAECHRILTEVLSALQSGAQLQDLEIDLHGLRDRLLASGEAHLPAAFGPVLEEAVKEFPTTLSMAQVLTEAPELEHIQTAFSWLTRRLPALVLAGLALSGALLFLAAGLAKGCIAAGAVLALSGAGLMAARVWLLNNLERLLSLVEWPESTGPMPSPQAIIEELAKPVAAMASQRASTVLAIGAGLLVAGLVIRVTLLRPAHRA
jgi:hypothetical protein